MSKVQIEIPDDRWFRGEWDFRPQDKQLCVVIMNDDNLVDLRICQYRNGFFVDHDCGVMNPWSNVDRWKPLGLPTDVNEWVLAEIEKWFEEDE